MYCAYVYVYSVCLSNMRCSVFWSANLYFITVVIKVLIVMDVDIGHDHSSHVIEGQSHVSGSCGPSHLNWGQFFSTRIGYICHITCLLAILQLVMHWGAFCRFCTTFLTSFWFCFHHYIGYAMYVLLTLFVLMALLSIGAFVRWVTLRLQNSQRL